MFKKNASLLNTKKVLQCLMHCEEILDFSEVKVALTLKVKVGLQHDTFFPCRRGDLA